MIAFHDLCPSDAQLGDALRAAVDRVLASGWYVLGPEVEAFERELAASIGLRHAVGVANGTDALELALRAAGIGPGDEVITVSHTAVPTVAAIERAGARAVLADIDPTTYCLCPAAAAAAVTPRTRAIVPVHLYGHMADMPALCALAARHGLIVIEDCAQSLGASLEGRAAGGFGRLAALSFYPTKNLAACGDGGAIATDDAQLAQRLRRLRRYGQATRDESLERGINSRLDEIQAAILRVKLEHFARHQERRAAMAEFYSRKLAGVERPLVRPGYRHAWHLYVVRHRNRGGLARGLAARGIETLVHYPVPIHLQAAYRDLGYAPGSLPETERAAREVLSLPLWIGLSDGQLDEVAGAVSETAAQLARNEVVV